MPPGSPTQDRLRIAVMLDAPVVPKWVRKILVDLQRCDFLELAVVILSDETSPGRNLPARLARAFQSLLFLGYERLDRALFRAKNDAFEPVDASDLLDRTETIRASPVDGVSVHTPGNHDVAGVQSRQLDVILNLGSGGPAGPIARAARYGIWSLHHGDPDAYRGGPPYFWEMVERNPVSCSALEALTDEARPAEIIYRSYAATDLSSLYRNRNRNYWKASDFVIRRLRDLRERGWEYLTSLEASRGDEAERGKARRIPGNWTMARFLAALSCRYFYDRYQTYLLNFKWFLALRERRELTGHHFDGMGFEVIPPPKGRSWADPFLLKLGPDTHVFFEDVGHATRKGVISHMTIAADGTRTPPCVVLERDYHLSYPFVFESDGRIYMIPETGQNRTVELYRASEFPLRWELEKVLFNDVYAVDATLFEHGGRFWLFVNMSPSGGASDDELFLFHSGSPLGPWTPHPMNPIVSDVRRARPAGRLFRRGQDIIRPSQDCSLRYGCAIVLNRIETLSETEYREVCVARIEPDWHPDCIGTHTINRSEDLEIIDGYALTWKWRG